MSNPSPSASPPLPRPLSVAKSDIERVFGVSAAGGTAVNSGFAGVIALILTTLFFVIVHFLPPGYFRAMLLDRGPTQYATVFLGFWSIVILIIKQNKLSVQRKALRHAVIPENHEFVLTSQTADQVIRNIHALADDPTRYLVYNRILISLSNLKNLGRVSDVDDILRASAERDESAHQTSFATVGGFLWAIPVLGFIGTVLGLAGAIGNFSSLLDKQSDVSAIVGSLKEVTGGLSTAFETTLLSLVVALVIQLWMTSQRKAEEVFLDDCQEYCLKQIVSRIKILPFEPGREV
ncbi:MotA/TolQ/ExbB proton channel family protein [Allorhodopirellula solitaria]|uniref:MotA/TolQ/ExbB proton channel family protein n=1 Tax=Allorhodopirellula solitaria TaxID=2527987 RepID=A0A5C5XSZ6_9BACT|nr:MotA/TolQ/ExbB proton channel family protein [Allorhodopirellula solitaria]TWT66367.1 MotA/TolQ/ExbB proton channel family protein [Allorhodopirellula solitaria]